MAEDAPGIPSRATRHELPEVRTPTRWEFGVHAHDADKRGPHLDLRLGDPMTGHAHSWAMEDKWPGPGTWTWATAQPTHTVRYMDFKGKIPFGYGKGDVALRERGKIEVINAAPGHITFHLHRPRGTEEYTLHRVGPDQWKFYNRTFTRDVADSLPLGDKPTYRSLDIGKALEHGDDHLMSAKIDDAHNLFVLDTGKQVRVVSHRESDRPAGLIEHTHKVPSLRGVKAPAGFYDTVLRGGVFALDPKTGKAISASRLGGLINSGVEKSRADQAVHGELRPVIYDVVRYRGKDLSSAPYEEKLRVLEAVSKAIPALRLPPMARTAEAKQRLLTEITSGRHPLTSEGVVLWPLKTGDKPIKAKVKDDHDVYVRGFFSGEGKYTDRGVGGFVYSHTPDGKVVGRVGTGLTDAQREDMHRHPEKYLGMVAVVQAMEKHPSGALRAPSFQGFHLDKNPPERLSKVYPMKTASELLQDAVLYKLGFLDFNKPVYVPYPVYLPAPGSAPPSKAHGKPSATPAGAPPAHHRRHRHHKHGSDAAYALFLTR